MFILLLSTGSTHLTTFPLFDSFVFILAIGVPGDWESCVPSYTKHLAAARKP
jgi:hypothetical protein